MEGILVPLFFFTFAAAIVLVPKALRSCERLALMQTARAALDRGEPLPADLFDALKAEPVIPTAESDLRKGAVLVAVSLAIAVMSVTIGFDDHEVIYPVLGGAAFPGLIGLVYIGFWLTGRNKPAA